MAKTCGTKSLGLDSPAMPAPGSLKACGLVFIINCIFRRKIDG